MKRILALSLLAVLTLFSCSKDDTGEMETSNFLVGVWESRENYQGEVVSDDVDGEFVYTFTEETISSEQNGEFRGEYEYDFDSKNNLIVFEQGTIHITKLSDDELIFHNGEEGEDYEGELVVRINE